MKVFGFWIYLMSDCVLFCCLFAAYAVLLNAIASGPTGKDVFELTLVLIETIVLLVSSTTYGISTVYIHKNKKNKAIFWLILTWLFGTSFTYIEFNEFYNLIINGFGPDRSAFLSAFFVLVGVHGLHVIFGLIWILVLIFQIFNRGTTNNVIRIRSACLGLFWHFLDIMWICIFSIVYLMGSI